MAIIQDWKIRSRAHRCTDTERDFEDGERVVTGIFADPESDGYLRKDFCQEAWARLGSDLQPFSFWQGTYRAPEVEVDPQDLGKESPETMLRRMIDEDEATTENARYILVLMLERKKILIPVDVQELESRRMLFYEHKENGDVFVIADPQLHLDEIEGVQEEVLLLLQGKPATESQPAAVDDSDSPSESEAETPQHSEQSAKQEQEEPKPAPEATTE
jgi:hypothetical protein